MATLTGLQPDPDDAQTFLEDLTSTSKVAIWRLMFSVHATGIWLHEQLFDQHKADVEARAAEIIPGTVRWYADQAKLFQYGDDLTWDGSKYVYDPVDASAQIVERSAAGVAGSQVRIKVAKLSGGSPVKLDPAEKTAFEAYMDLIKFAGTNVAVISKDGDTLHVELDLYYDPLVLASDGEDLDNPGTYPVEDAINDYIASLPFDGYLTRNALIDAIQAAAGVDDLKITTLEAKYGALPYSAIDVEYQPDAGYLEIDAAYPLNTSITYTPA